MLRICTSPPEAVMELPASNAMETELETSHNNNRQQSSSQNENESDTITSGCVRRIVKSTHLDDHQRTKKTETTVIMPKHLVALADHIDDDDDEDEEDDNLEWSPRSAQSIPSLLDDENATKMARHDRSNSDLTLEPCLDASIIETSQGLFVPHLIPEEGGHVEPAPLLRRCTTPPTIGKGKGKGKVNADTDITAAATVTPPTTPESSHRSSSMIMQEDSDDAGECYSSTTNSSSTKTPKRSNRSKSNNINSPCEVIYNEIQRKKSLQIKNFFRRLAKSVRKG